MTLRLVVRASGATVLIALLAFVGAGCGPSGPRSFKASGTVRLAGKPVEGADVAFYPQGGRPANGTTDATGRFVLRTWNAGDGAISGEHVVCVVKVVPAKPAPVADADPYAATKNALPERYSSPATSPLRATVSPTRPNEFVFDLDAQ